MAALKELTEADLHHVFSVERRGDTLIVAPRGDATSFPEHHFRAAVVALRRRLDGTHPCNVIVDLSDLDYPGLAMLDVFDDLMTEIGWRGETAVVAGASDDTLRVLKEYRLGGDWKHVDTLQSAIKAVVREPFWKPAARHPRLIAGVLLGLLLIVAASLYYTGRPHPDRVAFNQIMDLWLEYEAAQRATAETPDLIASTRDLSQRVDELAASVAERRRSPEVIAAAEQLQRMLQHPRLEDDLDDRTLSSLLAAAHNELERSDH